MGKRTYTGLFTAIGNFKEGKLSGEALKDYENYECNKYGGFGNFENECFISESTRMNEIGR